MSSPQFFGYLGAAFAVIFANAGAAYGTAKSSVGIMNLGLVQPQKIFRSLIPVIMAGILGIYGLIIAILMAGKVKDNDVKAGYKQLASGLCCGLSALASGLAIGVVGDHCVRSYAQSEGIYVGMIIMLIFGEALGLYGMIIAIIMSAS